MRYLYVISDSKTEITEREIVREDKECIYYKLAENCVLGISKKDIDRDYVFSTKENAKICLLDYWKDMSFKAKLRQKVCKETLERISKM